MERRLYFTLIFLPFVINSNERLDFPNNVQRAQCALSHLKLTPLYTVLPGSGQGRDKARSRAAWHIAGLARLD